MIVQWCAGDNQSVRYLNTTIHVDRVLDDSDGPSAGIFRWDNANEGSMYFLLSPQ